MGVIVVLVSSALALALHGRWHDHYTTAGGVPCCGARDCVKARVRLLASQPETVTVEINAIPVVNTSANYEKLKEG